MPSRETVLRQYKEKDIDFLVERMETAIKDLPHYAHTTYDADVTRAVLRFNCGQDLQFAGFVVCNPVTDQVVGGIACSIVRGFVSRDTYLWDIFFFIEPEWRSLRNAEKLFIAMREWALARGVKLQNIRASTTSGYKMEKLDKLMLYMGMEPIGTLYQYKEIARR